MTERTAKRLTKIRDGGKCRMCGRGGVWQLHSHHILPKALFPDLAASTDNLITLCLCCHLGIVHGGKISDGGEGQGNWRLWVTHLTLLIR